MKDAQKTSLRKFHQDGSIPRDNVVWVFGSNLRGAHGAGAAKIAKNNFGARYGVAEGRVGMSYAIPTKSSKLEVLGLEEIRAGINRFIAYANKNEKDTFFVTRVGCGLAGIPDEKIAPMFKSAPANCSFAREWAKFLEEPQHA